jgi:hypothetical protein
MRKILWSALLLSSLFCVYPALALNPQTSPKQVDATATTLKVEWDNMSSAIGYYVYYSTTS